MNGDGPHEAEQFAGERRHGLIVVFAAGPQRVKRLCNRCCAFQAIRLASSLRAGISAFSAPALDIGPMLVGPSRFHQHPAQMRIPGLGDRSPLDALATRVLPRHQAAVAINWRGLWKRVRLPNSQTTVAAVVCATPRNACKASITARISGGACATASSMACSSFAIRSAMWSTSSR